MVVVVSLLDISDICFCHSLLICVIVFHFQDPFVALLTNIPSRPQASLYRGAEIKAEVSYPIKASDDNNDQEQLKKSQQRVRDLQTRKQDLNRIIVSFIL